MGRAWGAGLAGAAAVLLGAVDAAWGVNTCMMATNFTRPAWKASNDMFMDYQNVTGTNPWNPQFVQDCMVYKCVRNMDADHINASTRSQWTQRPVKTDRTQSPIAYEWMIDICNRMGADLWVCIPHLTVNRNSGDNPCDYAIRLAILVKTGVDMRNASLGNLDQLVTKTAADFIAMGGQQACEPLPAPRKLYVEYSNETWNDGFQQAGYCDAEGTALGLGGDPGARFHGWAALRIFRAAELVFGVNSPRLGKVLAGWTADMGYIGNEYYVLNTPAYNPWGVTANAMAIAPYIGNGATSTTELRNAIGSIVGSIRTARRLATQNQLQLLAYEAGQHVVANCIAINSEPAMYGVYREYLDTLGAYFDMIAHFSQVGIWGGSGCWGAKRYTGQTLAEAHKYRAIVDWAAANPYAPTAVAGESYAGTRSATTRLARASAVFRLDGRRVTGTVSGTRSPAGRSLCAVRRPDGTLRLTVRGTGQD